jgi:hypothetical protein
MRQGPGRPKIGKSQRAAPRDPCIDYYLLHTADPWTPPTTHIFHLGNKGRSRFSSHLLRRDNEHCVNT